MGERDASEMRVCCLTPERIERQRLNLFQRRANAPADLLLPGGYVEKKKCGNIVTRVVVQWRPSR